MSHFDNAMRTQVSSKIKLFTRWLVRFDENPLVFAIKRAALCSLIPLPLTIALTLLAVPTHSAPAAAAMLENVAMLLLVAPILENAMLVLLAAYMNFFARPSFAALIAAAFVSLTHSIYVPLWGILVFPAFFVQALIYLAWKRDGRMRAYLVTVLIHALTNIPGALATSF
jgi:hypothetical protein